MPTYDSGTDTLTLTGTETSPDTLDSIVSTVNNSAKASKVGNFVYFFSFVNLNGGSGFIEFPIDTETTFTNTLWTKNGSTGGMILDERSIVRFEGTGVDDIQPSPINANTGYKFIAKRDRSGVNPQYILATGDRYDIFSAQYTPSFQTPYYNVTGLDISINRSSISSVKIYPTSDSVLSDIRIFTRGSSISEFQVASGTFNDLWLENTGFSTSNVASSAITINTPVIDFLGTASDIQFNYNATATIDIVDPIFRAGAWTGNYFGRSSGFRSNSDCVARISFTDSLTFLSGSTGRQFRVRHARNDGTNIDATTSSGGVLAGTALLTSYRDGSGSFSTGSQPAIATYTWSANARSYAYKVAGGNDVLYSAKSFSAQAITVIQLETVPFLTLTESAASALTGISFTASGSTGGTVSITSNHTVADIWQYYRQWISSFTNFGSNDTWDYDGLTLNVGAWNVTVNNYVLTGNITSTATIIIMGANGDINGVVTDIGGVSVKVTAPNLLTGSRVQIYDVTDSYEVRNELILNTGGFKRRSIWEGDKTFRLRATYTNGTTSYLPVESIGTLTSTGISFLDSQVLDTVYNTNSIDGSTVTEFSADYTNSQIDVNDSDGTTTVQRLYAWVMYNMLSSSGIKQFFNIAQPDDLFNYKFDTSVANLKIKNTGSTPVIITGGRAYRSDKATIIASGGSIQMDPNSGIADPNQIADALLNRDMSLGLDTNARTPRNALRALRNKISVSSDGTTLIVTKEDDTATAWTAAVTSTAGAAPIVGIDPA